MDIAIMRASMTASMPATQGHITKTISNSTTTRMATMPTAARAAAMGSMTNRMCFAQPSMSLSLV